MSTEHSLPASHPGSVVLDIGDGAGALVVFTDPALADAEIEIRRCGQPWRGVHTAVRPRRLSTGVRFAGVFGSLSPGSYDLRIRGGAPGSACLTTRVSEGSVSEVRLPS